MRIQIFRLLTVLCLQLPCTFAQEAATTKAADPDPLVTAESDYIFKDFHFFDGESLPELKLHYRTIGQPASNPSTGEVKNAVLLIHGTTGTGKEFLAKGFRDAMFEPGQPLDATKSTLTIWCTASKQAPITTQLQVLRKSRRRFSRSTLRTTN